MSLSKHVFGVTGPSGSGKTQLCQKIVGEAIELGYDVAGFVSPAIFSEETKIAINVKILPSGKEKALAILAQNDMVNNVYGKWKFDQKAIDLIQNHFLAIKHCDMLIVDEIGPLEIDQGKGWHKVLQHIDQIDFSILVLTFREKYKAYFKNKFMNITIVDLNDSKHVLKFQHSFQIFLDKQ